MALETPSEEIEGAEARRRELYGLLGDLPPRAAPDQRPHPLRGRAARFVLEKLVLDINGLEPVPAYFVKPKQLDGKAPAILFNHWHAGEYKLGKDETSAPQARRRAVLRGGPDRAGLLRAMPGHVVLRRALRAHRAGRFKEMLWKGQVLWGMMVYDTLRGLDYLPTRPEVDTARIGTLGHVHGQHDGLVGGGARSAAQGLRRHLLPDRLPGADRGPQSERPRRLLLRARAAEALHHRADQCADRAAAAPGDGRQSRRPDAAGRAGPDRARTPRRLSEPRASLPTGNSCATTLDMLSRRRCGATSWPSFTSVCSCRYN